MKCQNILDSLYHVYNISEVTTILLEQSVITPEQSGKGKHKALLILFNS